MVQLIPKGAANTAPAAQEKIVSLRWDAGRAFALLTAVLAASVLLPMPASNGEIAHVPDFCPFYRLTGLPCPGCGLTRAFVCIGHGQFAQALQWHPAGWAIYAIFVGLWLRSGVTLALGKPILRVSPAAQAAIVWISLIAFLAIGAVRIGWLLVHHVHYV